jgi:molybdopterin molybdotransferase
MLELEQALERLLAPLTPLPPETIPIDAAAGRRVATAIEAATPLPPFDNSAMDGYAVRADDVAGANADTPVALAVVSRIAAGQATDRPLQAGECARVFTGSMLPPGCDAVVMQEDTRPSPEGPGRIQILDPVKPWENVRLRGEDVRAGSVIASPGMLLTPSLLGLLSAGGIARVAVHRRPVVAVLRTGNELTPPGEPLKPGHIYESNGVTLAAAAAAAGADVRVHPLVPDRLEETCDALRRALEPADLLLTTGGVSVGELDLLKEAFTAIGGATELWQVAIKPGKPFACGRWNGRLWCGLPGNPVSAYVTFMLLARPAILRLQGVRETGLPVSHGELGEAFSNPGPRRHFVRVCVDASGRVMSAGTQASHAMGSLGRANALLDLPPRSGLRAGERVRVLRLD